MDKERYDLVNLARRGNKEAIEKLIKQEQVNIYAMLFYLNKNCSDITDIAQNILIKLASKIRQLKNPNNFKCWLNQIVLNTYYDYLRHKKRNVDKFIDGPNKDVIMHEIADNSNNPSDFLLNNELDLIIKTSISDLPVHYKVPITLREIQGLSYDEISSLTRTSLGTVKSRIARARAIIKDKISGYIEK